MSRTIQQNTKISKLIFGKSEGDPRRSEFVRLCSPDAGESSISSILGIQKNPCELHPGRKIPGTSNTTVHDA